MYVLGFVLGAVMGSTASALAYRLPLEMDLVFSRSMCPQCGSKIAFYDNVPLLSYLVLQGRCRRCHKKISTQYFLLELFSALLFAYLVGRYGLGLRQFGLYLAAFLAITASIIDLKVHKIPNKITYSGFSLLMLLTAVEALEVHSLKPLVEGVESVVVFGGSLVLLAILSRGMGLGDAKLVAMLALALAPFGLMATLYGLVVAFLAGSIVGVILMAAGKATRKSAIPFGPFITLGFLLVLIVGKL